MKMNKKEIKEKIEWFELNNSGYRKLNGGSVKVLNLKIKKKEKRVYADIILIRLGEEGFIETRYNNCYYSFKLLGIEDGK